MRFSKSGGENPEELKQVSFALSEPGSTPILEMGKTLLYGDAYPLSSTFILPETDSSETTFPDLDHVGPSDL